MSESTGSSRFEERVDLIDRENRVIGTATRSEVRARNLLHRGVGILCANSRGQLYVHRRTQTKDVFPGLYDMFVGGVVSSGEFFEKAALRELEEELGIEAKELEFLFSHLYEGDRNRALIKVYRTTWDGPISHQAEEVAWGAWIPEKDLPLWIQDHPVVPDGLEIFFRYLEWKRDSHDASHR